MTLTSRIDGPLDVVRDAAAALRQTVHVTSNRVWGVVSPFFGDDQPHGTVIRGVPVEPATHEKRQPAVKAGDRRHVGVHPDIASYWAPEDDSATA